MVENLRPVVEISGFEPELNCHDFLSVLQSMSSPLRIHLPTDAKSSLLRGYAVVTYRSQSQANEARKTFNGLDLYGKLLFARILTQGVAPETANIFIKNLPLSMTAEALEELCPANSLILASRISRDTAGISLGYGYIQFLTEDMAVEARSQLNKVYVNHRFLAAEPFIPKAKRMLPACHTVFLFDCPLSEPQVQKVFSAYGEVTDVTRIKEEAGLVILVRMQSRKAAIQATQELNEQPWRCSLRPYR